MGLLDLIENVWITWRHLRVWSCTRDNSSPVVHFLQNFFFWGHVLFHPRMLQYFGNCHSVCGVFLQHTWNQWHKRFWIERRSLCADVSFPELVESIYNNVFIMDVICSRLSEGRISWKHNEKNDSRSKQINCLSRIVWATIDFWRCVPWGTNLSGPTHCFSNWKSKVSYFESPIICQQ